jgi:hypothetical protein
MPLLTIHEYGFIGLVYERIIRWRYFGPAV